MITPVQRILWQKQHRQSQRRFPAVQRIKDTCKFEQIMQEAMKCKE